MIKTIDVGSKKVKIDTSIWWLSVYRNQFGNDILMNIMPILDMLIRFVASGHDENDIGNVQLEDTQDLYLLELSTIPQVLWAMAYNADPSVGDPETFQKSLKTFPLDTVVPELLTVIAQSMVSTKNLERLQEAFPTLMQTEKKKGSGSKTSSSRQPKED